jgi:hypothetical protein
MAAAAAAAAEPLHSTVLGGDAADGSMRRIASAPALRLPAAAAQARCACAAAARGEPCGCLDVFVVSRAFTEIGGPLLRSLPPEARASMVDLGICQ